MDSLQLQHENIALKRLVNNLTHAFNHLCTDQARSGRIITVAWVAEVIKSSDRDILLKRIADLESNIE